jgi:hypothetical protein
MGCGCKRFMDGDTGFERSWLPWARSQPTDMGDPVTRWGEREKSRRRAAPVVLQLLSKRELVFDGRANAVMSVPFPAFDASAYGTWVLSVAVAVKTGFLAQNKLIVNVQNVVVDESNPAVVFTSIGPDVTITTLPAAPHLGTSESSARVGPQARLMLEWQQGPNAFSPPITPVARIVLSAFLTLRPKTKGPVT